METMMQSVSRTKGSITRDAKAAQVTLARGVGWGLVGGLTATLVMDLVLMGALSAVGWPAFACYTIVGDTVARFLALLGIETAGGMPLGAAAHYLIGPLVGALFGAASAQVAALRTRSLRKRIVWSVLYVEILSQPLLATTPILLRMTAPATLMWYGGSCVMHAVLGVVLGVVMHHGLAARQAAQSGSNADNIG